jgi:hypothetical protein
MPSEDNLKFTINYEVADIDLTATQRKTLGNKIIDRIVDRTRDQQLDKNNKPWKTPTYSESYAKSLDFKAAGKQKGTVNLSLTGDMLDDLKVIEHGPGYIDIGYKPSYSGAGKVEGNVIGSYGQPQGRPKLARNFLGIEKKELGYLLEEIVLPNLLLETFKELKEAEVNKAVKNIMASIKIG